MYEVWCTQGQGGVKDCEFMTLREALAYVTPIAGVEGSFAIRKPNGTWYDWTKKGRKLIEGGEYATIRVHR
jgi:hypothetical protein